MARKAYSEEDRVQVRNALMTTMIQCIADRGLIHSSIDVLCRKVGISKTFFYSFFSSKEELVLYALRYQQPKLLDYARSLMEDPGLSWRAGVETFLKNCCYGAKSGVAVLSIEEEQQVRHCLSEENFQAFRRDQIIFYGKLLSIFKQSPFAEDTELCAALLVGPQDVVWNAGEVCTLPSGEEVNFYQVIPLYRNEMEYKMEHDADALLKKMAGISFVVNPTRQNAITRGTLAEEEFTGDMDDAAWHLESIQEKGLPVNEINAYNHMAIYLRWCIEHNLMSAEFMERYWEQVQPFMADLSRADLRGFIRDQLKGQLFGALFNKEGAAFAGYYYGEADSPYFPSDIDNYALEYFGSEQYYSDKFQDEAYLFIPFDENYYQAMAKVMEKRFANWQGQSFDEATLEPSDLAEAMMEYLDCECTYFPSMTDDDPIMSAYNYAKRESVKEGFVPVLIKADDEILWECLIMNSDPDSDGEDDFAFDPDKVAEYRKKMLSAPVENSKAVLEEMIGQRKEEAEDDDMDWDEEILGEMEGGYDNRRFSSYWNSDNNMTYPLILAKIPVKNPWEIFAYLPFGGWNECPNTPELMAVAKYWFEQHEAVPAAMSHDELEFLLPAPVPEEKAMDAAVELYGFCPDVIDQGPEDATVGALADVLRQSTVWYFWWD